MCNQTNNSDLRTWVQTPARSEFFLMRNDFDISVLVVTKGSSVVAVLIILQRRFRLSSS